MLLIFGFPYSIWPCGPTSCALIWPVKLPIAHCHRPLTTCKFPFTGLHVFHCHTHVLHSMRPITYALDIDMPCVTLKVLKLCTSVYSLNVCTHFEYLIPVTATISKCWMRDVFFCPMHRLVERWKWFHH